MAEPQYRVTVRTGTWSYNHRRMRYEPVHHATWESFEEMQSAPRVRGYANGKEYNLPYKAPHRHVAGIPNIALIPEGGWYGVIGS